MQQENRWLLPVEKVSNGTQVLAHTAYEVDQLNKLSRAVEVEELFDLAEEKIVTGPALLRDLYTLLANRNHTYADTLQPTYKVNKQIIDQFIGSSDFASLHEVTQTSRRYATYALQSLAEPMLEQLSEKVADIAKKLNELERKKQQLREQQQQQQSQAQQLQADQSHAAAQQPNNHGQTGAAAANTQAQADAANYQAEQTQAQLQSLEEQIQAEIDALDAALAEQDFSQQQVTMRAAIRDTENFLDSVDSAVAALAQGYDCSGSGKNNPQDIEQIMTALQRTPSLKEIVRLAGRMTRIALKVQMSKSVETESEITGVTRGNDMTKALPNWLATLQDEDLADLAILDIANHTIPMYEMVGKTPEGEGPIEIIVDGSGSMETLLSQNVTCHAWARAVTLAILTIARKTKRDVTVVDFGAGNGQLKTWTFPKGESTIKHTLDMIQFTWGQGTTFEPWMAQTMERISKDTRDKADVIVISDGEVSISTPVVTAFNELREQRGMNVFSIQIGDINRYAVEVLDLISDHVFTLSDLAHENDILQTVFKI